MALSKTQMEARIAELEAQAAEAEKRQRETGLNPATQAQGDSSVAHAGDKVVVANKLPFAVRIRLFRMVNVTEQRPNGPSKEVAMAEALPDTYVINGTATLRGAGRGLINDGRRIVFGYALTEGIDRESYEKWLDDNRDQNFIKHKLIFAMPSLAAAESVARENERRVTNLEPIDPNGDARMSREVKTATRN